MVFVIIKLSNFSKNYLINFWKVLTLDYLVKTSIIGALKYV